MGRISHLLTAAAFLLCMAPAHAQLVANGTLDSDAGSWSLGGGCGDEMWDGGTGNPPGSIRLNACGESDSDPAAAQTINGLTVGTTYTIKVDVMLHVDSSGGGTGKSFGIFLNSEPASPLRLTEFLDNNWHTVTTKFTASSTSATIIFAGELDARTPGGPRSTTDVSYFIDNISLIPQVPAAMIPTLSVQALLALLVLLAAGGLAVLRARRGPGRESRP